VIDLTDKEDVIQSAKSYAAKGFLCSESVLLAISEWLEIRNELIPKMATGFGAGIGGYGSVCGAISGGIMALGLKFGRNEITRQETKPYWFALDLLKRFEKEFGCITCQELTGCDITTETGRKKYREGMLWETKCRQYIESVTAAVFDLILKKS
jgi:C_GCAxxG_C_C family probable redox protein